MSGEIFIAYATPDRDWAVALHANLSARHRVFIDVADLQPGQRWAERIRQAEQQATMTVVLVSEQSRRAHYQYDEIIYAIDAYRRGRLTLVPLYLARWPAIEDVPYGLRQLQGILWADARAVDTIGERLSRHFAAWTSDATASALAHLDEPPWIPRATDYFTADGDLPGLLHGMSALSTNAPFLIQRFLGLYLGTSVARIPFGGRDDEMQAFDHWLDDTGAPGYRLLTAPAGQGKSAFLAHWAARVEQSRRAHVAFVPISARVQTNVWSIFLPALAARLSAIQHVAVPALFQGSPAEWRGVIARLLAQAPRDGRRILVVIDGLDEAADWQPGPEFLPLDAPPHLRVVISAGRVRSAPHPRRGCVCSDGIAPAARTRSSYRRSAPTASTACSAPWAHRSTRSPGGARSSQSCIA